MDALVEQIPQFTNGVPEVRAHLNRIVDQVNALSIATGVGGGGGGFGGGGNADNPEPDKPIIPPAAPELFGAITTFDVCVNGLPAKYDIRALLKSIGEDE